MKVSSMDKKKMLAGIILMMFVFTGCAANPIESDKNEIITQEKHTDEVNSQKQAEKPFDKSILRKEADKKVEQYLKGIMEKDYKLLVDVMSTEQKNYYPEERARAAIKDLAMFFQNDKISYRFEGEEQSGDFRIQAIYKYKIFNEDGRGKTIKVISSEGQIYITGDIFLTYSHWAQKKIDRFIQTLRIEDAEKLAASLSVDDLYYPLNEAEKVIALYENKFDLLTLDYKFIGINEREDSFIYLITGEKNGNHIEHELTIICGDGFTSIIDNWIPSNQEVGRIYPG